TLRGLRDANAITQVLRDATEPTIDRAIVQFGSRCRGALNPEARSENGMPERYHEADAVMAAAITDQASLARLRERRWGMDAGARQGFRAARDAEWRLQGVIPETAAVEYDQELSLDQAAALSGEGIAGTLSALADCHEQVFLAIRAVLRGTDDHVRDLPYDWSKFHIADRGDGRLTLEIAPEVFDRVREKPPATDDPWTSCPAIPFIRQYHQWSALLARRFYLPHLPRLQAEARSRRIAPAGRRPEADPQVISELKL
ncbi:MAG TPA: hypothetical protein PKV72_03620, partial [Candidatus Peribacteria bacterium]|nr:hypothetical protein [Candidatus Peribacteria bacterium]